MKNFKQSICPMLSDTGTGVHSELGQIFYLILDCSEPSTLFANIDLQCEYSARMQMWC